MENNQKIFAFIDFEVTVQHPVNIPAEVGLVICHVDKADAPLASYHALFALPKIFLSGDAIYKAKRVEKIITGIHFKGAPGSRNDYLTVLEEMEALLKQFGVTRLYAKSARMENVCLNYLINHTQHKYPSLLKEKVLEYHDLIQSLLGVAKLEDEVTNKLFKQHSEVVGKTAFCKHHFGLNQDHYHCALKDVFCCASVLCNVATNSREILSWNEELILRNEAEALKRKERKKLKEKGRRRIVDVDKKDDVRLMRVKGDKIYMANKWSLNLIELLEKHKVTTICWIGNDAVFQRDWHDILESDLAVQHLEHVPFSDGQHEDLMKKAIEIIASSLKSRERVCLVGGDMSACEDIYRAWRLRNTKEDVDVVEMECSIVFKRPNTKKKKK